MAPGTRSRPLLLAGVVILLVVFLHSGGTIRQKLERDIIPPRVNAKPPNFLDVEVAVSEKCANMSRD